MRYRLSIDSPKRGRIYWNKDSQGIWIDDPREASAEPLAVIMREIEIKDNFYRRVNMKVTFHIERV